MEETNIYDQHLKSKLFVDFYDFSFEKHEALINLGENANDSENGSHLPSGWSPVE